MKRKPRVRRFLLGLRFVLPPVLALASVSKDAAAENAAPAPAPESTPETATTLAAVPAPSCGASVVLVAASYADMTMKMELPKDSVAHGAHTCFVCPASNFCAVGTKEPETRVGVWVEGRLVAIDQPPTKTQVCDDTQRYTLDSGGRREEETPQACELKNGAAREPWFVAVPSVEVPARSIIKADTVPVATQVLRHGTPPRRGSFTIDASGIGRWGSPLGSVGTGVGITSMTRSVRAANIPEAPEANEVSPLGLGLRYDVALFTQDWLHRLSVVAEYDLVRCAKWTLTPGLALGLGASFENGNNSTIQAGLLAGFSAHLDYQVAWQIAAVVGVTGQGIFVNGSTQSLLSIYAGPRVGF